MNRHIDWMGSEPPSSWKIFKLKHVLREEAKEIGADVPAGAISFGEVVFKDFNNDETLATYRTVRRGQFLINPLNLNYDLKSLRIGLSEIDCRVSPAYIVATHDSHKSTAKYLRWALRVFDVQHIKTLGAGVRQTVKFEDIGECRIALPDLDTQKSIDSHLDRSTTRIDTLVAKKTRFIELLREKRQALITHAVTKGLNPNVPMKDSGVVWQGEVPATWSVAKLNFRFDVQLGKMLDQKKITGTSSVRYLRNRDVQWSGINTDDLPTMDIHPHEIERYTALRGDLLVCEGGEVGRAAIWMGDRIGYQKALHRVRPRLGDSAEFLRYVLMAAAASGAFAEEDSKSTISHLTAEKFRTYKFPFPPHLEQRVIVSHLNRATARIDTLIAKTERSIELLRERRTALITAAVTGKIDLRSAA